MIAERIRAARAARESVSISRDPVSASTRALARVLRDDADRGASLDALIETNRTERAARDALSTGTRVPETDRDTGTRVPVTKPGAPMGVDPRGVSSCRVKPRGYTPQGVHPRLTSVTGVERRDGESLVQAYVRMLDEARELADARDSAYQARAVARALPMRERDEERLAHEDESVPHWLRPRSRKKVRRLPPG